jgi:hypothetical protein
VTIFESVFLRTAELTSGPSAKISDFAARATVRGIMAIGGMVMGVRTSAAIMVISVV